MTSTSLSRLFLAAALAPVAFVPACGLKDDDADEFRGGVPRHETVEVRVPGAQQGALTADGTTAAVKGALLGEKADYYSLTRAVTAVINGGTAAVLILVKTITRYPATSVSGDTAVWGPHTEPLSPNTWRLTVTRLEPHKFQYALDAKAKTAGDSAFLTILAGTHTRAIVAGLPVEGFGAGTFTLDWDAAQMLPEHGKEVGKATFVYARESLRSPGTIDVDFKGVKEDKTGELFDAVYKYAETPGMGGNFQYSATQDYLPEPGNTGTAKEKLTIRSRWQEDGAGRSDVRMSGGDLTILNVTGTANECWDSNFGSVYMSQSWNPTGGWGAEARCVFATAEYSTL
jgi:hypothetical protein